MISIILVTLDRLMLQYADSLANAHHIIKQKSDSLVIAHRVIMQQADSLISNNSMTRYEAISVWEQGIWIFVTVGGVILALRQLRISSTVALLQAEVMLFDYLRRIDDSSADIFALTGRPVPSNDDEKKELALQIKSAQMKMRGAIQNYLNSLDRYCSCVLRRIVPQKSSKLEYKSVLDDAVIKFQEYVPEFDKHFPNIVKLRARWRA